MPDALAQRLWAYEYFSREDTSSPADEDAAESPSRSRVADDTVTGGASLHRTGDDAVTEVTAEHPAAGDAAFGERSPRRAAESGAARHADIGESDKRFESDLFAGLG
jgi:hypothetical protein